MRASRVGDEAVLLDLRRGTYFTLNPTAAWLWTRIEAGATLAELRDGLVASHDVDAATAWADLVALVAELLDAGLVERVDPAT